jgi:hypothetical protein
MRKKQLLILVFGILLISSCSQTQTSQVTSIPTETAQIMDTAIVYSPSTPTIAPSSSPTLTPSPAPTLSASPTHEISGPFQVIASLGDLLDDFSGTVEVRAIQDGSVWVISQHKVLRWDGETLKEILSSSHQRLADVDGAGRLWVLYPDGQEISALQDEDWSSYDASSGWRDTGPLDYSGWAPLSWSIHPGPGGTLWVPLATDVRSLDGNRWTVYTLEDMDFPAPDLEDVSIVHRLVTAPSGSLIWVGECYYSGPGPMGGGGVRWFDGQAWYGADGPVGANCVSAMHVDALGNIWVGAYMDIWRNDPSNQHWTKYSLPHALFADYNFSYPLQLTVDQAGDVWVIMEMCGGASCGVATNLYRIQQGEWSLALESNNWVSSLQQLVLDANGQAWLFWENMLYRLDGDTIEPVASINARGVGVSPAGTIWLVAKTEADTNLMVLQP